MNSQRKRIEDEIANESKEEAEARARVRMFRNMIALVTDWATYFSTDDEAERDGLLAQIQGLDLRHDLFVFCDGSAMEKAACLRDVRVAANDLKFLLENHDAVRLASMVRFTMPIVLGS